MAVAALPDVFSDCVLAHAGVPLTVPVNVGDAYVLPEAIDVAFPDDVIGPVRFAFVVTFDAVRFAIAVVDAITSGAVPVATVEVTCPVNDPVVKAPVLGVVAPMAALLMPVIVKIAAPTPPAAIPVCPTAGL